MSLINRHLPLGRNFFIQPVHSIFRLHLQKRYLSSPEKSTSDYELKYAKKLIQRAQERGLSIDELRARAKEEAQRREQSRSQQIASQAIRSTSQSEPAPPSVSKGVLPTPATSVRKDSSPIKPLSSIIDVPRLLASPHTAAQISALWTAYHASRSGGTGRGYVCASIPVDLYEKMASVAGRYPAFVVPVRHVNKQEAKVDGKETTAYEFYFLQWGFHEIPPMPTTTTPDPFSSHSPPATDPALSPNLPISTLFFTPLQEYKLRNSFATPYMVLTHYTDLTRSHGLVLMRGEITPAAAAGGGNIDGQYLLTQENAQLLAMCVQKFYLWGQGEGRGENEGEKLLKAFHEKPDDFQWEELLKHANLTT